jgi:hypothetical protein
VAIVTVVMAVVTVPAARTRGVTVIRDEDGAVARNLNESVAIHMDQTAEANRTKARNVDAHDGAIVAQELCKDTTNMVVRVVSMRPVSGK